MRTEKEKFSAIFKTKNGIVNATQNFNSYSRLLKELFKINNLKQIIVYKTNTGIYDTLNF